ncbi:MAG: apolipoprotein N-acyltransferase, partial [Pyrinomonadaceae bacterium]
MAFAAVKRILPSWTNVLLALVAAGLLILAFPDFEIWWSAWFALVPLMWAVERQKHCVPACFLLGWIFGTAFFFGTCWWLTYAPIHYAAIPWPVAYLLILIACLGAGVFPGIFAAVLSILLRRFGSWAFLAAPFVWVFSEFLRYWLTGNNWNAIGYSQFTATLAGWASTGGVISVSFVVVLCNLAACLFILGCSNVMKTIVRKAIGRDEPTEVEPSEEQPMMFRALKDGSDDDLNPFMMVGALAVFVLFAWMTTPNFYFQSGPKTNVIAVQPNVPMSGINYNDLKELRQRQFDLAEAEIRKIDQQFSVASGEPPTAGRQIPTLVILPESPMNFMYNDDREFQQFVREFTTRNKVSLLFNSAEPDAANGKFFNSAVMIGSDGKIVAQYDKIYLLPFGEAVPMPLESIVPAFVGNFSYGREYDLLPVGDAKAGIMICFESHFGQLSRQYVADGADVLIEMTNDGYLGPTPVLRQHLANAVFRAVETNRPVLRVTNVGITTYINEQGAVID